jgi:predicted acylesterase/phospholipase RssA
VPERVLRPIRDERLADLKLWFPGNRPEPEADLFEIGLVLSGGQSAGCYLAGVVDFLFEALDCWRDGLREDSQRLPNHRVRIKIIVGASAGGLNAALAAICARYRFTPASQVSFEARDENLARLGPRHRSPISARV